MALGKPQHHPQNTHHHHHHQHTFELNLPETGGGKWGEKTGEFYKHPSLDSPKTKAKTPEGVSVPWIKTPEGVSALNRVLQEEERTQLGVGESWFVFICCQQDRR